MRKKPKQKRTEKFNKKHGIISFEEQRKLRQDREVGPDSKEEDQGAPVYLVGKGSKKVKKKLSPREMVKRKRKVVVYLIIFAVLLFLVGKSVFNIVKVNLEEKELKKESATLKEEQEELEEELTLVNDPEYIEQQARDQLHLVLPGEILYVLPPVDENQEEQKDSEDADQEGLDKGKEKAGEEKDEAQDPED